MKIELIKDNKKQFLALLLLADEQESMIDKYLDIGDLFALYDDDLKSICVVTNNGDGIYELKNLATLPIYQKMGYGSSLIKYIFNYYKDICNTILVGTGESLIPFYEHCGFSMSHVLPNFFTDNYDHPIIDNGIQLIDMVYLKKEL